MMRIEEEIFKRSDIEFDKLLSYGFQKHEQNYIYRKNIMHGDFRVEITVTEDKQVIGKIYDVAFEEEYQNYRMEHQTGTFTSQIRSQFIDILNDIKEQCTRERFFISDQANRITSLIIDKYGIKPEFIWDKFPGYGVFRNPHNQKWYVLIANINRNKFGAGDTEVEIINVKLAPEKIPGLLERKGFYPAYHMNKKYWVSIVLDDTLTDKEMMEYIEESYHFTQ